MELRQVRESNVDIVFAARMQDMELKPQSPSCRLQISGYLLGTGIDWIDQSRNDRSGRQQLTQDL